MKYYKFIPTCKENLYKFESQDYAKKIEAGEAEWTKLGTYTRTLPGRKLSFEKHGEALRVESQEEWDNITAEAEAEIFGRMEHHEPRICPEREVTLSMGTIDRLSGYDYSSTLHFNYHLNDIETNGINSEKHQDSLDCERKGFYHKLDYFIRDDILENETNREFRMFREGMSHGYQVALEDAAQVESNIPELREVQEQMQQTLADKVVEYFIKEFGEDELTDETLKLSRKYGKGKSIAMLAYMIKRIDDGKLI